MVTTQERKPIEMEREGVYRLPGPADRVKLLRPPTDADYHLYFSPSTFSAPEYEASASCIAENLESIRDKLAAAVSRSPIKNFPDSWRVIPPIAVERYADFSKLERRFKCPEDATITIRPNGMVYAKRFVSGSKASQETLIGYLIDEEHQLVVDTRIDLLNDMPQFAATCVQSDGAPLNQLYQLRRVDREQVWRGLGLRRKKTQLFSY
jgi:hypothetical protein